MKSLFRIYAVLSTLLVLCASHPYNYYQQQPGYYHQQWRQPETRAQYLPPDHEWQIRSYHQPPERTYSKPEVVHYQPVEDYPVYPEYSSASHEDHPHQETNHIIKKVKVPITGGSQIVNLSPNGDAHKVKITQVGPKSDGSYDDRGLPEVVKQALAKFLANEKNSNNHTHSFTIIAHDDVIVQQSDSKAKNAAPVTLVHNHPVLKHHQRGQKPYEKAPKTRTSPAKKTVKATVIATGENVAEALHDDVGTIGKSVTADALALLAKTQAKAFATSNQNSVDVTSQAHQTKHTVYPTSGPAHKSTPISNYKFIPTHAHFPGDVNAHKPNPIHSGFNPSEEKSSAQEVNHTPEPAQTPTPIPDYNKTPIPNKPNQSPVVENKSTPDKPAPNDVAVTPNSKTHLQKTDISDSSHAISSTDNIKHTTEPQTQTSVPDYDNTPTTAKTTEILVEENSPTPDKAPNDTPVTPKSDKLLPKTENDDSSDKTSPADKVNFTKVPAQKQTPVPDSDNTTTPTQPTQSPVVGNKPTPDKAPNDTPVPPKSEKLLPKPDGSDSYTKEAQKTTTVSDYDKTKTPTKPTQSPEEGNKPSPDKNALNDAPVTTKSEKHLPKIDGSDDTEKVKNTKEAQTPTPVPDNDKTSTSIKPTQSPVEGNKPSPDNHTLNDAPVTPKSEKHLPKTDGSNDTEKVKNTKEAQTPTPVPDNDKTSTPIKPTQSPVEGNKPSPDNNAVNDALVTPKSEKHLPKTDGSNDTEKVKNTKEALTPTPVPDNDKTSTPIKPTQSLVEGNKPSPDKNALNDALITPKSEKHLPKLDGSDDTENVKNTKEAQTPTPVSDNDKTSTPNKPTQSPVEGNKPSSDNHTLNDAPVTPKSEKHLLKTDDSDDTEKVKNTKGAQTPTPVPDNDKTSTSIKPTQSPVEGNKPSPDNHTLNDAPVTPKSEKHSRITDGSNDTEKVKNTKEAQTPTPVPDNDKTSTPIKPTQSPVEGNKPSPDNHAPNDAPLTPKSDKHLPKTDCCDDTEKVKSSTEAQTPTPVPDNDKTSTSIKPPQSPVDGNKPSPDNHAPNDAPLTPKSDKHLPKTDGSDDTEKVKSSTEAQTPTPVPDNDKTSTSIKPPQSPAEGNKPSPDNHTLNDAPVTPKSEKHLPKTDGSDDTEKVKNTKEAQTPTPVPDHDKTSTSIKPTQSPVERNKPSPDKQILNDAPITPKSEKNLSKTDDSDDTEKVKSSKETQTPTPVPDNDKTSTHIKPTQSPVVGNKPSPDNHAPNDAPLTPKSDKHLPKPDCSNDTEKVKSSTEAQTPTPIPDNDKTSTSIKPTQSPVEGNKPSPDNHTLNDAPVTSKSEKHLPKTDSSDDTEKVKNTKEAQTPTPVPDHDKTSTSIKPTQSPVEGNKPSPDKQILNDAPITPKSENNLPKTDDSDDTEKVKSSKETQTPTPVPDNDKTSTHIKPTQSPVDGNKPSPDNHAPNDAPLILKSDKHLPKPDCSDDTEKVKSSTEAQTPTPVPDNDKTSTSIKPPQSPVEGNKPSPDNHTLNDAPVTSKSEKHLPKTDSSDDTEKVKNTKEAQTPTPVPDHDKTSTSIKPTQSPVEGNKPSPDKQILNDAPITPKSEKNLPKTDDSNDTEKVKNTKEAQTPTPVPDNDKTSTSIKPSQSPVEGNKPSPDKHAPNDAPLIPKSDKHLPKPDCSDDTEKVKSSTEAQTPTPVPDNDKTSTSIKPPQSPVEGNKPSPDNHTLNDAPVTSKSEKHLPKTDSSDDTEKVKNTKEAQTPTPVPDHDKTSTSIKPTQSPVEGNKPSPDKQILNDAPITPKSEKNLPKTDDSNDTEKVKNTKEAQTPTPVPDNDKTSTSIKPSQSPVERNKPSPDKQILNDAPVIPKSEKHSPKTDGSNDTEKVKNTKEAQTPTPVPDNDKTSTSIKPPQSPVEGNKPSPDNHTLNDAPVTSKSEKHLPKTDSSDDTEKVKNTKEARTPTPVPDHDKTPTSIKPTQSPVEGNEPSPDKQILNDAPITPKSEKNLPKTDDSNDTEKVKNTKEAQTPTPVPDNDKTSTSIKPSQSPVEGNKPSPDKQILNDAPVIPKSEKHSPKTDGSNDTEKVKNTKEAQTPTPVPDHDKTSTSVKPTQSPVEGNKPSPDKQILNDAPITPKSEKNLPKTDDSNDTEKVKNTKEAQTPTPVPDNDKTSTAIKPTQSSVEENKPTSSKNTVNVALVTPKSNKALPKTDDPDLPASEIESKSDPAVKPTRISTKKYKQDSVNYIVADDAQIISTSKNPLTSSKNFLTDLFHDLYQRFPKKSSGSSGKTYVIKCANPSIPIEECGDQLIIVPYEDTNNQGNEDSAKDTKPHHCCGLLDEEASNEKTVSSKKETQESDIVKNYKYTSEKRSINNHEEVKTNAAETDNTKQEENNTEFDGNETKTQYVDSDKKQTTKETKEYATKNSKTESVNPISYIIAVIRRALSRNEAINQFFNDPSVKKTVQRTLYY